MVRFELLFHQLDPGVLVRRVRGRRKNRDLTGVTDLLGDQLDLLLCDSFCICLAHEDVAALRVSVGVEGDDLDSGVTCLVQGVAQRRRVVRRDDERADTLLRGGVDERHLRIRSRLVRADLLDRTVEVLGRLLAALGTGIEVRVAEVLREERDPGVTAGTATVVVAAAGGQAHARRQRQTGECGKWPILDEHGVPFLVIRRRQADPTVARFWGSSPYVSGAAWPPMRTDCWRSPRAREGRR